MSQILRNGRSDGKFREPAVNQKIKEAECHSEPAFVIEIALRLRKLLQAEGLDSWPKTTGGKGLHLMVPIDRDISHDAARLYCKRLAQRLEATEPARYTTSSAPAKRNKRIYIDYLRNGRGTTAVGAYSPRARRDSRSPRR